MSIYVTQVLDFVWGFVDVALKLFPKVLNFHFAPTEKKKKRWCSFIFFFRLQMLYNVNLKSVNLILIFKILPMLMECSILLMGNTVKWQGVTFIFWPKTETAAQLSLRNSHSRFFVLPIFSSNYQCNKKLNLNSPPDKSTYIKITKTVSIDPLNLIKPNALNLL